MWAELTWSFNFNMRYLQKYELYEALVSQQNAGSLGEEDSGKVACLGKFFAKLDNVLPLQETDFTHLERAGESGDMVLLAAAAMVPASRNSAGFPMLFEAVCGYAKIDQELAGSLTVAMNDLSNPSQGIDL
jgi:hypothetical protein